MLIYYRDDKLELASMNGMVPIARRLADQPMVLAGFRKSITAESCDFPCPKELRFLFSIRERNTKGKFIGILNSTVGAPHGNKFSLTK